MNDIQTTYRRNEGADYPLEDGGATFDRRLHYIICGIVIGCVIGILGTAIFVTT